MATAIHRSTWNSLTLDVDFDSANDVLMTSLSPVLDTNLYSDFETETWTNDIDGYLRLPDDPLSLWQHISDSSNSNITELTNFDWSLTASDVTSCEYDVTSLPWQRDADESLMRRAMIPTVVESERVTDDDECERSRDVTAAAAAADSQCPRAITGSHVTQEVLSDVTSHDVSRRDVNRPRGNSSNNSCGVPPSPTKKRYRRARQQQQLWQFLLETLSNPKYNPCYIEWLDRSQGIFRFVESQKIARLWGLRRKRANMTY